MFSPPRAAGRASGQVEVPARAMSGFSGRGTLGGGQHGD